MCAPISTSPPAASARELVAGHHAVLVAQLQRAGAGPRPDLAEQPLDLCGGPAAQPRPGLPQRAQPVAEVQIQHGAAGLQAQRSRDLLRTEEERGQLLPPEGTPRAGDAGGDEDRCGNATACERHARLREVVEVPVVERDDDPARRDRSGLDLVGGGAERERAQRRDHLDVLGEVLRSDRDVERVVLEPADPVVQERDARGRLRRGHRRLLPCRSSRSS